MSSLNSFSSFNEKNNFWQTLLIFDNKFKSLKIGSTLLTTIIIDVSGSMRNNLPHLKECIKLLLNGLPKNTLLSLITFNHRVNTLVSFLEFNDENKLKIIKIVEELQAESFTNICDALNIAFASHYPYLDAQDADKYTHNFIFFTDGISDHGNIFQYEVDDKKILEKQREFWRNKYNLTLIGFGEKSASSSLLLDLSNMCKGKLLYTDNMENIAGFFGEVIATFTSLVAKDIKLTINNCGNVIYSEPPLLDVTTLDNNKTELYKSFLIEEENLIVLFATKTIENISFKLELSLEDQNKQVTYSDLVKPIPYIEENFEICFYVLKSNILIYLDQIPRLLISNPNNAKIYCNICKKDINEFKIKYPNYNHLRVNFLEASIIELEKKVDASITELEKKVEANIRIEELQDKSEELYNNSQTTNNSLHSSGTFHSHNTIDSIRRPLTIRQQSGNSNYSQNYLRTM